MTNETTRLQEVDGQTYLGTAADGTDHYADGFSNTATVVAGGEVVLETDIPSIPAYVEHVADVTGWCDLRYSNEPLGEWLAKFAKTTEAA